MVKYICDAEQGRNKTRAGANITEHCSTLWNITDAVKQREFMQRSFLKVNIFYESLNFESIIQSDDYGVSLTICLSFVFDILYN